jgi:flagellar biogenesis protein FliO
MPWSFWAGYFEKLAILALVLVAIYLVGRKLRQSRLFAPAGRRVRLLESVMLSQHAALYVVRVGTRHFLIGSTAGGVSALAELGEAEVSGGTPLDGACPPAKSKGSG